MAHLIDRPLKVKTLLLALGLMLWQQVLAWGAAPQSLSLRDAVGIALENNYAIHLAVESQTQARLAVSQAEAGKLPTVSWGSGYNWRSGIDDESLNSSLRLSWQLYDGGQTAARIDQAEIGAAVAALEVAAAKQQVALDATTAYFAVLEADKMLAVNQETVDNLQAHLDVARARYEAGLVAKADVLRAEVEAANARQNLIVAKNQRQLALTNFLNILNLDADTAVELVDELGYEFESLTLEEALAEARQNRPEVAQAKLNVVKADKGIDIASSGKRPSIGLSASTGWNDSLFPDGEDWSVGLSASWNVFDGGVTKAQIEQAKSARVQAELKLNQTLDTIEQEVRQSYLSMKEAEERLQTTQTTVDKALEDVYIAQEKYKVGMGTNLDVIDAQLALTQAKTNHVKALYDYNVSRAKLAKAIGRQPVSGGGAA